MSRARRPPDEGRLLQLVYYGYVGGSALARALPERFAYWLANLFGGLQARLSRKKAPVVARNIARITGEPIGSERVERLVREAYKSYARYWLETFRLVREDREFFLDRYRCRNDEAIDKVLARGKGAIVVVCHLGNWDAAGAWVGARGNLLVAVAEVLRPRRIFDFFVTHRSRLGMRIIPAATGAIDRLCEAVDEGAVVAIIGDRDLKGRGPVVEFFGEPVSLPAGPAIVALRTGVPLLTGGVWGTRFPDGKRGWECEISEPIELPAEPGPDAIAELTQAVARNLEDYIRRRPEEWHVFQPVWPSDKEQAQ